MTRRAIQMLFKRWKAVGATTPKTTSTTRPGYYDDSGDWVPPGHNQTTVDTALHCAILPLDTKFIQASGGTYSTADREIYLYEQLTKDQVVTYKGINYQVAEEIDVSDFSGVYVYTLKAVSSHA